jgi:hypothetical protein
MAATWHRQAHSTGGIRATLVVVIALCAVPAAFGESAPDITYRFVSIESTTDLHARFEAWQIELLEHLNRRDVEHLAQQGEVVVPDVWHEDPLVYSPLPRRYAWARAHPKALVVHQPWQVFGAYEDGVLVRWGSVSSGRHAHPTPEGLFHLNWRSPGRHSTVNPRWFMRWYWNFHNERGLAFHEYAMPGYPASHACVRLLARDARWLYDWGEGWTLDARGWEVLDHGTPVLIVGTYDFEAPPPWHALEQLAEGVTLPAGPAESLSCRARPGGRPSELPSVDAGSGASWPPDLLPRQGVPHNR